MLTCNGAGDAPHEWESAKPLMGRPPKVCPDHDARVCGRKVCNRCGEVKPVSDYSKGSNRDGLNHNCKTCARALTAQSRTDNPGRLEAWRKANPDRMRAYNARNNSRRAAVIRGAEAGRNLSWRDAAERDGMHCTYCGVLTVWKHQNRKLWPTLDHVIPISKGGPHAMENAVLACFSCNARKGNRALP